MSSKPSWVSSTLSQLLLLSVGGYLVGVMFLAWRGKADLSAFQWLVNVILPLYASRKGAEMAKNGNGGIHEPVQQPPNPS